MEHKVTAADVREEFPEEKRRNDFQSHLWAHLVVRPLSFYITPFFLNRGISANAVTGLGLVVLLAGLAAIVSAVWMPGLLIMGAVLINVWYFFDFVDGNIARFTETSSPFGAFCDWYVGLIYHTALPLCVGVMVYVSGEFTLLPLEAVWWLVLAVAWVIAMLSRKLVAQKIALLTAETASTGRRDLSRIEMLAGAYTSFKSPLFVVTVVVGMVDIWMLLFGLYAIISAPVQLGLNSRSLGK